MSKRTALIIVCSVALAALLWWLFMFFQERGLEKHLPQNVQTLNADIHKANEDEKLNGEYNWSKTIDADQLQYKNVQWKAISSSRLAGISPSMQVVEKKTDQCEGISGSSLRKEGCLCVNGYWLEGVNRGKVEKIDTAEKLNNLLAPIDNVAKAVSLVVLTNRDLLMNDNDVPRGHTLAIAGGYVIQVVKSNFCGCSTHQPFGVIYKVTTSGVVTQIATEIVPRGNQPEICID